MAASSSLGGQGLESGTLMSSGGDLEEVEAELLGEMEVWWMLRRHGDGGAEARRGPPRRQGQGFNCGLKSTLNPFFSRRPCPTCDRWTISSAKRPIVTPRLSPS
ncbi:Neuronal acetylcholine receptor subunit alpha-2 [Frankliniella fusca]|uniref:Neuronal acetylcholine receptor subunit alpha-2 n=1 Tax=Frankliniella fusca TaxID=407009 RepID=A0AAE1LKM2_9NEOP|nr:Neuronal acetylcholine receptor subunit alpha-2 [Frankliniella fusca]